MSQVTPEEREARAQVHELSPEAGRLMDSLLLANASERAWNLEQQVESLKAVLERVTAERDDAFARLDGAQIRLQRLFEPLEEEVLL